MNHVPSTEDRVWSVLSHLSALTLGLGVILPIIGWADQRRKSPYASLQCLQALGYQSLGYTIWVLFSVLAAILLAMLMLAAFGSEEGSGGTSDVLVLTWIAIFAAFILGSLGIYFLLPIIAAILCAIGKDFRYPILGNRLARYLEYHPDQHAEGKPWLAEDREFRWVAAMGHFSILILLWGMAAPLTAWILYGRRSFFLKLQSVQTLVYQGGVTVLYLGTVFLYLSGVMIISLMALTGWAGRVNIDSPMGILGIIFLGGSLLATLIVVLFLPFFHILGQWAGYRVLKGDDYRYPLIGRLVEKSITKNSSIEEQPV